MVEPAPQDDVSRNLYVFIDESGNFDFSSRGTDFLIEAAVMTREPVKLSARICELRYQLMSEGYDDLEFHASENKQAVRDRVYEVLRSSSDLFRGHVLYLDKHRAAPAKQNKIAMVELFAKAFVNWLEAVVRKDVISKVVMMFDSVLTNKEQAAFNKTFKPRLKKAGLEFAISFAPVRSEPNGQVADYIAWAFSRKLERGDLRPMQQLEGVVIGEFDLFRKGHTRYYE